MSKFIDSEGFENLMAGVAALVLLGLAVFAVYGATRFMDKTTPWRYSATYCQPDGNCVFKTGDTTEHTCPPYTDADFWGTTQAKLKSGTCKLVADK
jgi:hypothetical protein